MSQIMVIATAFVNDTWHGSKFMKTFLNWKITLVDWCSFLVFIGIPLFIATISLCTGVGHWWLITSISWLILVLASYLIFAACVICTEIYGCIQLIKSNPKLRNNDPPNWNEHNLKTFLRAILFRTKQGLSGYQYISYISHGDDPHPDKLSYNEMCAMDSAKVVLGLLGRLSQKPLIQKMYTVLDRPLRQYDAENVLKSTPYFTSHSWGLESVYCRNRNIRYIAVIDGIGALGRAQTRSSIVCYFLGTFLTIFTTVSVLVWFSLPSEQVVVVVILSIALLYQPVKTLLQLLRTYYNVTHRDGGGNQVINTNKASDAFFQVHEMFKVTEPNSTLCWVALCLEFVFFFIIPIAALLYNQNYNVGIVFIFLAIINLLRDIFNTPACVRELGSLKGIEENNKDQSPLSIWREKNRLGKIITDISVGKNTNYWSIVFFFFTFVAFVVLTSAFALGTDVSLREKFQFCSQDDFVFEGTHALNYASCSLGSNMKSPGGDDTNSLADFAFLSALSYQDDESAAKDLITWFGNNTKAENLVKNVEDFQRNYHGEEHKSAVKYKLFSFPDDNLQIVSVRGTANSWDALADLQLWSSTALAQYVRSFLPLGEIWTNILSHIVKAISVIQDQALTDVSYYRETTAFVESLNRTDPDTTVQITGHCKYFHLEFLIFLCRPSNTEYV